MPQDLEQSSDYLAVDGRSVPLRFRVNRRSRRLILRVDEQTGGALVTLPPQVSLDEARQFAQDRCDWLARHLTKRPARITFEIGAVIPVFGQSRRIRYTLGRCRPVTMTEHSIEVSGAPEHLAWRVADWLRAEARRQIEPRALKMSAALGRPCRRVAIRDTRSRWGSCSTSGTLSFSFRLVMAPLWVLDYVVAHEAAHLIEHNHGPRFWQLVSRLNNDADRAHAWLKSHGASLHLIGR